MITGNVSVSYLDDRAIIARMARSLAHAPEQILSDTKARRMAYEGAGLGLDHWELDDYHRRDKAAVHSENMRKKAFAL